MKKWILLLLCGVFVPLLGACGKKNFAENGSTMEYTSSLEISESVEDSDISSGDDTVEGGGGSMVNGYYEFNTYEEYKNFYNEFVKLNEERYYTPNIYIDQYFDVTDYMFSVAPISVEIANNDLYIGVEFPSSQTMEFYFSNKDDSVVGVHKSVTIRGEVFDVSQDTLVGNKVVLVQTDDEGREYEVHMGDVVLCSFEIGMTGYDNKEEYLQLIENGFIFN